jgi:hypothetical protein
MTTMPCYNSSTFSLSLSWMSKLSQDGIPTIVDKFSRNQKHKT